MRRDVTVRLALEAAGPARLAFAVGVSGGLSLHEEFVATQHGEPLEVRLLDDAHGSRLHIVDANAGGVAVSYTATAEGLQTLADVEPLDEIRYLRPSRYCESDILRPIAVAQFGDLKGVPLLTAVTSWVGVHVGYLSGSSLPTDGAVRTFLSRQGVCRDFAHLVVAFLRALDVPARVASVYAPGLYPMDFHAVAEAVIDGRWQVVDATTLAPRGSLLRIATGRDAADTAFLSSHGADVQLYEIEVAAVVDALPDDDVRELAELR